MNGIIDSISNLLMPLCSVWIVNKFVNNSFEKKESKKIFTRIIWGLFILIQIVMETEKGNVSIQKGIISFFVILGIIIYFLVYINLDIVGVFCIFYFKYI